MRSHLYQNRHHKTAFHHHLQGSAFAQQRLVFDHFPCFCIHQPINGTWLSLDSSALGGAVRTEVPQVEVSGLLLSAVGMDFQDVLGHGQAFDEECLQKESIEIRFFDSLVK